MITDNCKRLAIIENVKSPLKPPSLSAIMYSSLIRRMTWYEKVRGLS